MPAHKPAWHTSGHCLEVGVSLQGQVVHSAADSAAGWCKRHRSTSQWSAGLGLQGLACAPDLRPHIILRRRRLTKTESKKGVGLIETELARSASETSDAAAAARSGRDMEDVGASCIVGTVRGEDYNFQVRPSAGVLACCCSWGHTWREDLDCLGVGLQQCATLLEGCCTLWVFGTAMRDTTVPRWGALQGCCILYESVTLLPLCKAALWCFICRGMQIASQLHMALINQLYIVLARRGLGFLVGVQCKCQTFPSLMLGASRAWQGCCREKKACMLFGNCRSWAAGPNMVQVLQGLLTQLALLHSSSKSHPAGFKAMGM